MKNATANPLSAGCRRLMLALLFGAALLVGCDAFGQAGEPDAGPAPATEPAAARGEPAPAPDLAAAADPAAEDAAIQFPAGDDLGHATFLTESTETGTATFSDGQFRQPVAPGSSAQMTIRLGKWAIGDIDGNGDSDAAAITIENPGGSGTFYYLHAFINQDGDLRDQDTAFLGDRIRVEGVSVHDQAITVAILDRYDDEPFAATPTRPVIRTFRLEGNQLTEQNPDRVAGFGCDGGLPDAPLVIVRTPAAGAEVMSGFAVRGCSRTFESNVQWRLIDRRGEELAMGHASGGGVDGPARFEFNVSFQVADRQLASLNVYEEDVSEGEGYPPPRAVVPVILNPL